MHGIRPLLVLALFCVSPHLALGDDRPRVVPEAARAAAAKALAAIEKSTGEYRRQRGCFSCHHQTLPVLALSEARRRGFQIDEKDFESQIERTSSHLRRNRAGYLRGRGQGGRVDTAAFALWALEAGGYKPDETTAAVAEYLLLTNASLDHWTGTSSRPPTQGTDVTRTAIALRSLAVFGAPQQRQRVDERTKQGRAWLLRVKPRDTEEKVYRLHGLAYLGAVEDTLALLAADLVLDQRDDGGWAQRSGMQSDAYATGTALAALHQGGVRGGDRIYQRGMRFLIDSQLDDGSWRVRTRSRPIQKYFESGFPHGKDQFISMGATCWAAMALMLALPEEGQKTEPRKAPAVASEFDQLEEPDRAAFSVRFEKELWPLFKRNGADGCVGCHTSRHRSSLKFTAKSDHDFRAMLREGFFLPDDPGSILHVVSSNSPRTRMPPGNRPGWTKKEIQLLQSFVADLDKKQQN